MIKNLVWVVKFLAKSVLRVLARPQRPRPLLSDIGASYSDRGNKTGESYVQPCRRRLPDRLARAMTVSLIEKLPRLPVSEVLPSLGAALHAGTRAVLSAPPGAGKTTLVPLFLLDAAWRGDGKPRRGGPDGGAARGEGG